LLDQDPSFIASQKTRTISLLTGQFFSLLRSLVDYLEIRKIDGHYIAVQVIIAGVKKGPPPRTCLRKLKGGVKSPELGHSPRSIQL